VLTYNLVPLDLFWRWFPLFNAFEFCLGIWIVQKAWYPKKENASQVIRKLADVSFYVFLFHVIIFDVFRTYVVQLRPLIAFDNAVAMNDLYIGYSLYYLQMMAAVLAVSWIAMEADNRLQAWILRQEPVKKFLQR
jgi:peptidoglycan/LPS O-acetylase OafA/YrhL